MLPEFKSWHEIKKFLGVRVIVTEKIHGTNAQVCVFPTYRQDADENDVRDGFDVGAGSRTRWLTVDQDNYGFAAFIQNNKAELIEKLGEGRHYGKWVGPGINGQYGLEEKRFVLFSDAARYPKGLPNRCDLLPVLYDGPYDPQLVERVMAELKGASRYAPGFDKPEGVVLYFPDFGVSKKKVFTPEESAWSGTKSGKSKEPKVDTTPIAAPFLQPIRLEKLLMRDQSLATDYPKTIPAIVKAYVADLQKETELTPEQSSAVGKHAFAFVREEAERIISTMGRSGHD